MYRLRPIRDELGTLFGRLFTGVPALGSVQALSGFVDAQSAFVVQKGIYEYSRARSGHYSKVLFKEPQFLEAVEKARWSAYPLGLAMVGELVEGALRPLAHEEGDRLRESLRQLVLSVFDRYAQPSALDALAWSDARRELARRMQLVGLHPVKRAFEIADPFARAYFELLPIDQKLKASEYPTIHNYLRVTLCNVHAELTSRMDGPALVAALLEALPAPQGVQQA